MGINYNTTFPEWEYINNKGKGVYIMPITNISNGTIEEITREQGNTFVTVRYMGSSGGQRTEQTIRLVVGPRTIIVDRSGVPVRVSELREGMLINATVSSAMTRSIPPQATAYLIRILRRVQQPQPPRPEPPRPQPPRPEPPRPQPPRPQPPRPQPPRPPQPPQREEITVGTILNIDSNNRSFTTIRDLDPSSVIRFNVADNAMILDRTGRRISFGNLRQGMRVRVRHADFMTRSIPPQTTAFEIRVL